MQGLIVFALVFGCTLHAVWRLMPAVLRRKLWHREPAAGCGSGCDGCGSKAPGAAQPVHFHPRPPR